MKTKGITLVFNSTKIWKYQKYMPVNFIQLAQNSVLPFLNHKNIKYTPKKIYWSAQTSG